jgi:hypothetical protein
MDVRFMLMAIFSKGAALERVAGMQGVVRLLMQYTSYDAIWQKWRPSLQSRSYIFYFLNGSCPVLDHFLKRLKYYPRISDVELGTAFALVHHVQHVLRSNFQNDTLAYYDIMNRIFEVLRKHPVRGDLLVQEVFGMQGMLQFKNRFAKKEVSQMNYNALVREGIDIVRIHDDFRGCDAVLSTSRNEWVNTAVRITNDYPFKSPTVQFVGSLRPKRFARYESICIDQHFEYAFTTVEDVLRAVWIETETDGVISSNDPTLKILFL